MGVSEEKPDPIKQNQEAAEASEKSLDFTKSLVKELNIGEQELKTGEPEVEEEAVNEVDETEEPQKPETDEKLEDIFGSEEEETETEEDEDVIPKSKVQERFDELTAKNKALEAEIEALKAEKQKPDSELSDKERLEQMGEKDLRDLKREVRKACRTAPDDQVDRYLDLEDKIDEAIKTAPQRFQAKQVSAFNKAVNKTASELPGYNEEVGKKLFEAAKNIYSKTKSFQSSELGQAEAWNLAVEYYKNLKSSSSTKQSLEQKKQINQLKKKTSLDSGNLKTNVSKDRLRKLSKQAKASGSSDDQTNLIKEMFVKEGPLADQIRRNQ